MYKIPVVAAWLFVLLMPIPFISDILMMEEGHFAYLAVNTGKNKPKNDRELLLIGRVKGVDQWEAPRHPIIPYLVIAKVFRAFSNSTNFELWTIEEKTRAARLPFYITYVLSMLPVILMGAWLFKRKTWGEVSLPVLFIAFLGTCPLMVGGALQTYYDGNIGVLLTTLCALGLASIPRVKSLFFRAVIIFGCGFLSAVGKNEWVIAFIGATLGTMFLYAAIRQKIPHFWLLSSLGLIGAVVGSLFHFFVDSFNYLQGFFIMHSFGYEPHKSWIRAFVLRLPWMWPFILIFLLVIFILRRYLKELLTTHFTQMILLLWASLLFFGFIITRHLGDGFPRYFCPSMAAFLSFLVVRMEFIDFSSWRLKIRSRLKVLVCALIMLHMGYYVYSHIRQISIGSIPGRKLVVHKEIFTRNYLRFLLTGEVQKVDASMAYYFQDMDFKNNS